MSNLWKNMLFDTRRFIPFVATKLMPFGVNSNYSTSILTSARIINARADCQMGVMISSVFAIASDDKPHTNRWQRHKLEDIPLARLVIKSVCKLAARLTGFNLVNVRTLFLGT
jgi:hypothetical protein